MGVEADIPETPTDASSDLPPFDPYDRSKVKHVRIGEWDFYSQIEPKFQIWKLGEIVRSMTRSFFASFTGLYTFLVFLLELAHHSDTRWAIVFYIFTSGLKSVIPAVKLWYSNETLKLLQSALETRTIDEKRFYQNMFWVLVILAAGEIVKAANEKVTRYLRGIISTKCMERLVIARLSTDLPTYESVERRFSQMEHFDAWRAVDGIVSTLANGLQIVSQCAVLLAIILEHRAMMIFVLFQLAPALIPEHYSPLEGVWAATSESGTWLQMKGIERTIEEKKHKKEILSNNLQKFFMSRWSSAARSAKPSEDDFYSTYYMYKGEGTIRSLLTGVAKVGSELALFWQIMKAPSSVPTSFAMFQLTRQTTYELGNLITSMRYHVEQLDRSLQQMTEIATLPELTNLVKDGSIRFPENSQDMLNGISIEFRNVSFKYPGTDKFALHDVSFNIEQGQLCVIVGTNGSGKSTLLKLLLRFYDPEEGIILVNGIDIKELNVSDLRDAISVLFQDFSLMPFSVRDNIALGSPTHADDMEMIQGAAELAGATGIIDKLPRKYESFVTKPIWDIFHNISPTTKTLFGAKDLNFGQGGTGWTRESHEFSGGESQRLALARTFMRNLPADNGVGLLIFDEPSAALDPEAEYSLFQKLTQLRGAKTMIFSSHRFGNLTKHANIILYMKDSQLVEVGTHRELLKLDGGYASMYHIQADAFKHEE